MALPVLLFGSISLNLFAVHALTVTFNEQPFCDGTQLGQVANLSKGNCYTNYTGLGTDGVALGYQVDATSSDDGNVVVFYQFSDCDPTTEIALSNTPFCVSGSFGAFQVLGVDDCCLDDAYWQGGGFEGTPSDLNMQPSATITVSSLPTVNTASVTISTTAPSIEARRARVKEQPTSDADKPDFYHGMIYPWGNRVYKMHQLAHGVFTGVDLEDWNDDVHVKDDTVLDLPDIGVKPDIHPSSAVSALSTPNPQLAARPFKFPSCQAMLQCAYDIATAGLVSIDWILKPFVNILIISINRAKQINLPDTADGLWTFLNKPFVAGMLSAGFGGYVGALATAKSSDVSKCSTKGDEAEVLKDVVVLSLKGEPTAKVSDMSTEIYLPNGQTGVLTLAVRTDGDRTPAVCGAPTIGP